MGLDILEDRSKRIDRALADDEQKDVQHPFHMEGSIPVFEKPLSDEVASGERRAREAHEFARDQVETNRKLARFTVLLVVGTFIGSAISIWQARIAQTSADAAREAVIVARNTLTAAQQSTAQQSADNVRAATNAKDLSDKTFALSARAFQSTINNYRREQRAYLLPVDANDKAGAYGLLKISLRNYGHVSAKNARLEGTLDRISAYTQPPIQESIALHLPIASRIIPSDVPTFTWDVFTPNYGSKFPVLGDALRMLGTITYDDGFGDRDTVGVCYAFQVVRNQWELCGGDTSTYTQHPKAK